MSFYSYIKYFLLITFLSIIAYDTVAFIDFNRRENYEINRSVLAALSALKLNNATKRIVYDIMSDEALLLFVGDIMLDRGVAYVIKKEGDYKFPFLKAAHDLRNADLTIGNLEGPISDKGILSGSIYSFRANPKVIEGLQFAGFDVFSLANNHIFDYGSAALIDTLKNLRDSEMSGVGAGSDYKEANTPVMREVKGQKFAFLSYTTLYPSSLYASTSRAGISTYSPLSTIELIKDLKKEDIFVTILMHWGDEYAKEPNESQKKMAKLIIDAGADLIIGHHPHVVQRVEKIDNAWVAWSLGNFIFDQSFSKETMNSLALGIFVKNGKVKEVLSVPVELNSKYQPEFKIIEMSKL